MWLILLLLFSLALHPFIRMIVEQVPTTRINTWYLGEWLARWRYYRGWWKDTDTSPNPKSTAWSPTRKAKHLNQTDPMH